MLKLEQGTTVTMGNVFLYDAYTHVPTERLLAGDVTFGEKNWDGPLFQIK